MAIKSHLGKIIAGATLTGILATTLPSSAARIEYDCLHDGSKQFQQAYESSTADAVVIGIFSYSTSYGYRIHVEKDDPLSKIASDLTRRGHATTWQQIYKENQNVIGKNPDLIRPGQTLEIRTSGYETEIF